AQRLVATDSVNAFLYVPQWVSVANVKLKGVWKDQPLFVNDVASLSWD
ncbi:MAG: putative binding protein yliB precursor, partial [Rhizobacter sp.]|nr:putative binding protein yliB precursor [Rhizobacter sp.]